MSSVYEAINTPDVASKKISSKSAEQEGLDNAAQVSTSGMPPWVLPPTAPDEASGPDMEALGMRLKATFSNYLPEFIEFQQFGYNMLFPKAVDIDALQSQLRSMGGPLAQPLQKPAEAFLDKFRQFRKDKALYAHSLEYVKFRLTVKKEGVDDHKEYEEVIKHANRLVGYLSGTLALIQTLDDNHEHSSSWQDFLDKTTFKLRDELLPLDAASQMGSYANAQTRGNLTKDNPENIKFNRIVNSVTWDQRQEREALSAKLTGQAARLLSGIKLTERYAEKADKDEEVDWLAKHLRDVCKVLPTVVKAIKAKGEEIQPSAEQLPDVFILPKQKKGLPEEAKPYLRTVAKVVHKKALGAKDIFVLLSDKTEKNRHRSTHTLFSRNNHETNEATRKTNEAVFQAGLILSDKTQQTVSNIYKVQQAARPLQHAVELSHGLRNELSLVKAGKILDTKLEAESARWKEKAGESRKQLQETLEKLTVLPGESEKYVFLSRLREPLSKAPQDSKSKSVINKFDAQIKVFVDTLAEIEKGLGQVVVLSEHGVAGGKELDEKIATWLRDLADVKRKLKTCVTEATGRSIDNFSRDGMLVRRMGEVSESEKQLYLAELSPEDRTVAETQYDTLYFKVLNDYLPLLSKDTDPEGARLLERLRIEVRNAAEDTTLYPATMAEILAGMKSTEVAIRDWSRRKLIRGAFLAVCLQGVKLVPNLLALPLRVAFKFVITGAKVAVVAHKGRQGIRGGEGDVNDEIGAYARQSFTTATIKVVLSLPPGLATMLGVASIALDIYEGGLKGAAIKIAENIMGEAPWRALDVGSREAVESFTEASLNTALENFESTSEVASEKPTVSREMAPMVTSASNLEHEDGDEEITDLSAKGELKRMANESSDPRIRTLAQRLLAQLGDDDVQIEQSNRKGRAHYNLSTQTIKIGANSPDGERIHEIFHSLTAHKLRYARGNPESEHGQWAAQIDALRQNAKDAYKGTDKNTLHYLENVDEFVAGLYSGESDFIDHLRTMRTADSTILSNVIEFILRLLGLGVEQKSALTEAMGLSDKLIDSRLDGMDKDEHSGILYSPEDNAHLHASPAKITYTDVHRAKKEMERADAEAKDYERDNISKITSQTPMYEQQRMHSTYNDLMVKSYWARKEFEKRSSQRPAWSISPYTDEWIDDEVKEAGGGNWNRDTPVRVTFIGNPRITKTFTLRQVATPGFELWLKSKRWYRKGKYSGIRIKQPAGMSDDLFTKLKEGISEEYEEVAKHVDEMPQEEMDKIYQGIQAEAKKEEIKSRVRNHPAINAKGWTDHWIRKAGADNGVKLDPNTKIRVEYKGRAPSGLLGTGNAPKPVFVEFTLTELVNHRHDGPDENRNFIIHWPNSYPPQLREKLLSKTVESDHIVALDELHEDEEVQGVMAEVYEERAKAKVQRYLDDPKNKPTPAMRTSLENFVQGKSSAMVPVYTTPFRTKPISGTFFIPQNNTPYTGILPDQTLNSDKGIFFSTEEDEDYFYENTDDRIHENHNDNNVHWSPYGSGLEKWIKPRFSMYDQEREFVIPSNSRTARPKNRLRIAHLPSGKKLGNYLFDSEVKIIKEDVDTLTKTSWELWVDKYERIGASVGKIAGYVMVPVAMFTPLGPAALAIIGGTIATVTTIIPNALKIESADSVGESDDAAKNVVVTVWQEALGNAFGMYVGKLSAKFRTGKGASVGQGARGGAPVGRSSSLPGGLGGSSKPANPLVRSAYERRLLSRMKTDTAKRGPLGAPLAQPEDFRLDPPVPVITFRAPPVPGTSSSAGEWIPARTHMAGPPPPTGALPKQPTGALPKQPAAVLPKPPAAKGNVVVGEVIDKAEPFLELRVKEDIVPILFENNEEPS